MEIAGKNARVWIQEREGKNGGTFKTYSIGISRKNSAGKYANKYMKVLFGREVFVPENLESGATLEKYSGYLSLDLYTDREGKECKEYMAVITDARFKNYPSAPRVNEDFDDLGYSEADEDIPF